MVIVSFNIDTDFFINLAKLPAEVIALIFSFVPKCMLPELLYCSPIKKVAASAILSYVDVYDAIERHKWSYELGVGYPNCSCRQFRITQENLKQGIRQWKIFPKSIALNKVDQLAIALNDSREFFVDAQLINASFSEIGYHDYEGVFRDFLKSRFKFSCLTLSNHRNPLTLPPIAINVKLSKIKLNSYVIPGVKKLELNVPENQEERLTFSAELEDLIINSDRSIQVTLPPNLQKLEVYAFLNSVHFISEEMVNLEYLTIQLPNIRTFNETGIIAPNLKELNVRCDQLSNLEELRQFQHLKELEFEFCNYPFGLFNEGSFPELEKFRCRECSFLASEDFDNSLLTFPPNLKKFEIEIFRFQNVNFGSLVLPSTLTRLKLKNFPFDYDYLVDSLQYIDVHTVKLTLKSDFRIPHMAKEFILAAEYFSIDSIDFMYHLPSNLTHLSLHAIELGQMKSLAQMVKWPPMLRKFTLINFNIDHFKLKQLNLKESRLTKIHIYQGNVKTLDAGLFPVTT